MHKNNQEFFNKIITGNETWCFTYNSESKCLSTIWVSPQSLNAKKLHFEKLCIKTMLVAFFDSRGLIYKKLVPTGQRVNTNRCFESSHRVRPDLLTSGDWFLQHNNASAHNAALVCQLLNKKCCSPSSPSLFARFGSG